MLIGLSEEAFREQSGRIFANHVSDKEFASQVYKKKTLEAEFQNGNSFSKVAETISMKRCGCELGYEDTCITFFWQVSWGSSRESLYNLRCPEMCFIDQAGLQFKDLPSKCWNEK